VRIVTLNLNGIRSAVNKGFLEWMSTQEADAICVQEIKAQDCDLDEKVRNPDGFHGFFHCAERPGYSGVGIYCRKQPDQLVAGLGIADIDAEGRYLEARFGNLSIVSVYVPSGTTSPERLAIKFSFMARFIAWLHQLAQSGRDVILCGDWNVAHKEIDLKNWRSNRKNSGFLPEEREWFSGVLDKLGYEDVFRRLNQEPEQYTWWSNRGQAWAKNVGWRIDYQLATGGIAAKARSVAIYKDRRFSDHAPLTITYDYPLV
jgi:exodeoxyribonuclease-3